MPTGLLRGPLTASALFVIPLLAVGEPGAGAAEPPIRVSSDGSGFTCGDMPFVPWGFNYDRDAAGRLIEDYWHDEWPTVEADFSEMRDLGANVVRVHLQLGKFLPTPDTPDARELDRLGKLLDLADSLRLRIDLTGLGCYHKADVPDWYATATEADRWAAQERFWEAVASRCAGHPAVFCYDLMNEPVVPGGPQPDWLAGAFAGKHFVQFLTRDPAGRRRDEIAAGWLKRMTAAVRKHDPDRLVTVGLIPGPLSGFGAKAAAQDLDFLCVHVYPKSGRVDRSLESLRAYAVGVPVVVEETFPLACTPAELDDFLARSAPVASGWIGFYWGTPIDTLRQSDAIGDRLTLAWLERFRRGPPIRPTEAPQPR